MCIKEVTEVCRLCLKNENLVWVFDKRFETTENMRDVIFITTGVEIDEKDLVSKKICKKCLQIVIKIYQFRGSSIKNDTLLKNKYEELTKNAHPSTSGKTNIKKIQTHLFHPSVRHIMCKNPNLVLPQACFYLNMSPYVAMPMNYVETYFKKRNINMQRHIFYALQAFRSDRKPIEIKVKKENKAYSKHSEDECKEEKQYINIVSVDHNNKIKIRTVEKVPDSKKRDNQSDVEKTFSSRESTPDVLNSHKKNRKRPISDSSSDSDKQENTKPSTSEVSVKKWKCDSGEPVQMSFVARTIEICDICNSIQYSMRELKRHKLKHLRCQFCKDKFKTMECKEEHIRQDCVVRKTMNSLPTINLTKIDLNKAVRKKYPNAFLGFAPLLGLEGSTNTSSTDNINEKDSMTSTENVKASDSVTIAEHGTVENPIINQDDIIEILSDDDAEPRTVKTTETLNQYSKPSVVESNTPTVSTNENPLSRPSHPSTSTGAFHQQPLVLNADLPVISSSIVKPDIRIKNNIVLETIDPKASDMMVLKELLKNYKKIQLTKESATQPELPSNTSIIRNLNDFTTTLKDLNHQLRIYRIPVEVKHGVYKVSYDYSPKQKKTRKKADWNHLTPVEVKVNKKKNSGTKKNVTNNANYPNITLNDLLSGSPSYPAPNTISIGNSTSLNTTSVVTTQTLSNYSIPQEVPVTAPPPYTGVHLTSTSQSINTIPNQTPTMSYHSNNSLLAQIVYQPNTQSTVLINQPNNYVTYNPNNSVYNSSSPVMIPNSVPQVLVAASPVFATNPVFNSNTAKSLPVLPSTSSSSGISSFSDTSSSYSNQNTPNLISNQTSSSIFTPSSSSSNSLNNSRPIFPVENVSGIDTGSNNALTTGLPNTTSSMPLIRVKDLGSLK